MWTIGRSYSLYRAGITPSMVGKGISFTVRLSSSSSSSSSSSVIPNSDTEKPNHHHHSSPNNLSSSLSRTSSRRVVYILGRSLETLPPHGPLPYSKWSIPSGSTKDTETSSTVASTATMTSLSTTPQVPNVPQSLHCSMHGTAIVTSRGYVYVVGSNRYGELGLGEIQRSYSSHTAKVSLPPSSAFPSAGMTIHSLPKAPPYVPSFTPITVVLGGLLEHQSLSATAATSPTIVPLEQVVSVALKHQHSAVVTRSGRLFTFGIGMDGQLGHGGSMGPTGSYHGGTQRDTIGIPTEVGRPFPENGEKVIQVSVSKHFTLILTHIGKVYSCGSSFDYALGLNNTNNNQQAKAYSMVPEPVTDGLPPSDIDPVVCISTGLTFSVAATKRGRIFVWGRIGYGGTPRHLDSSSSPSSSTIKSTTVASQGKISGNHHSSSSIDSAHNNNSSSSATLFLSSVPVEINILRNQLLTKNEQQYWQIKVYSGLHHIVVALLPKESSVTTTGKPTNTLRQPRVWTLGLGTTGALGNETGNNVLDHPYEINLSRLVTDFRSVTNTSFSSSETSSVPITVQDITCGPYSTILVINHRAYITGRIETPLLLGREIADVGDKLILSQRNQGTGTIDSLSNAPSETKGTATVTVTPNKTVSTNRTEKELELLFRLGLLTEDEEKEYNTKYNNTDAGKIVTATETVGSNEVTVDGRKRSRRLQKTFLKSSEEATKSKELIDNAKKSPNIPGTTDNNVSSVSLGETLTDRESIVKYIRSVIQVGHGLGNNDGTVTRSSSFTVEASSKSNNTSSKYAPGAWRSYLYTRTFLPIIDPSLGTKLPNPSGTDTVVRSDRKIIQVAMGASHIALIVEEEEETELHTRTIDGTEKKVQVKGEV